jgi:hypothetical protein
MSIRTVSVKVNSQNPVRVGSVSYDNTVNVKLDPSQEYTVKKISYGVDRISKLQDVYAFTPVEGDVLVFNAITGKYVSKKIDSSIIDITNIDAGTF